MIQVFLPTREVLRGGILSSQASQKCVYKIQVFFNTREGGERRLSKRPSLPLQTTDITENITFPGTIYRSGNNICGTDPPPPFIKV